MQEKNIFPKEIDGVLNPWLDVADRIQGNPSCALFYQGDPNYFVASLGKDGHDIKDEDELITYKLPSSKNDEYNLITCIPPEPWQGNPLEAKLVILTLNPGYVEKQNHILADAIQKTFDRGGNVVIPAFAVGRTQELLYDLNTIQGLNRFFRRTQIKTEGYRLLIISTLLAIGIGIKSLLR